ncbi:SMODS domain-containing nucleotidyltransferase [Psychromonas sp. Urea-02u-13]|uniref:SMODS domain-containing nucleotidyltransferase n=1 Tax=Psychromonas sp. Urea-02u-13 TaxID=2058326 RepID=UPI000C339EAD|nr:nucleotidyltransferase [Psychromonas sp. Urea-02u-13]PKG40204.1 nucleotidyltransferase [Psychromonas sp. Urea-02u-13]
MTIHSDFKSFLINLQIKEAGQISSRYGSITRRLNMHFRDTESRTSHSLQVGSYGRYTGIDGISDLDMLYIMPSTSWDLYKNDQSGLLDACKEQIRKTYPSTEIKKDRNVVVVRFAKFLIEVVPVFEQVGKKYKYPDTYKDGSWKICDPNAEMKAFKDKNSERNNNLRALARMVRAWRNRNNIEMSGFLIDTLCYRFITDNEGFDKSSYGKYDILVRDFFEFLSNEPVQSFYFAPGSNSKVKVKKNFQSNAETAKEACDNAISTRQEQKESMCTLHYRSVFGNKFPNAITVTKTTTEEFIQDKYTLNLKHRISLDCEIKNDSMTRFLSRLLNAKQKISQERQLKFIANNIDIIGEFKVEWKILNQGKFAEDNHKTRGEILDDDGSKTRNERSKFNGEHLVECYAIQNDVVVAREIIEVPIA